MTSEQTTATSAPTAHDVPRIYVASLTDYNDGTLHGVWIDATQDVDAIHADIEKMLAASPTAASFPVGGPAEEYAIHDYDCFGGYRVHEYDSIERVAAVAAGIAEHGDIFAAWCDHTGALNYREIDELSDRFIDQYRGQWESVEDYAYELVNDLGYLADVPEFVATYFDYEKFARDLVLGGDIWTIDRGWRDVHVFDNYA